MIWSIHTLRERRPVEPFIERTVTNGVSGGVSFCGYDVHVRETINLSYGQFTLASTVERFDMPPDAMAVVHDKSTWARRGLAVQNTVIEPGWRGFLTLELAMQADGSLFIPAGTPIAQVVFHQLDAPVSGYAGKYQDQPAHPVRAILEGDR